MINKILVFGGGYVGSSLSALLSQYYEVILVDKDKKKVQKINSRQTPIEEPLIDKYLKAKNSKISASISFEEHIESSDLVILALPTNYQIETNYFDTSIIELVLSQLNDCGVTAPIIIKSTVPIGFTEGAKHAYPNLSIFFMPEFLREGSAVEDNINPSRIIIGGSQEETSEIVDVFLTIANNSPRLFYIGSSEAEAVKLFSNTYLAARVSFFNELDSYALEKKLNTKDIIKGVTSDPRIGEGYCNPSFGYGGYCLPKDTKQLLADYKNISQEIFSAVVNSNKLRKDFIAQKILQMDPKLIGIFRLTMKKDSKNIRDSAILDIIRILKKSGKEIIIFEPLLDITYESYPVTSDLNYFKNASDIIVANRMDESLNDVKTKVFSRDLFLEN